MAALTMSLALERGVCARYTRGAQVPVTVTTGAATRNSAQTRAAAKVKHDIRKFSAHQHMFQWLGSREPKPVALFRAGVSISGPCRGQMGGWTG